MLRKKKRTNSMVQRGHGPARGDANKGYPEGENSKLEKGDLLAMFIAAFGIFLPVLAIVTVLIIGILWFLFIR